MVTVVRVNPKAPEKDVIDRAAALIRNGGIVAFPTETVYGLGGNALDAKAVKKIYDAKGRPDRNPLIVHVASLAQAHELTQKWSDEAENLAKEFWPGPMTLIFKKRPIVPDQVTAGLPTVALRMPSHPIAHALIESAECPIAAPSANPSTYVSSTMASHVQRTLGDRIDLIIDGGASDKGIESTVIDCSQGTCMILRPGPLSLQEIQKIAPHATQKIRAAHDAERLPSPGMMAKHYAPHAAVSLLTTGELLNALQRAKATEKIACIVWSHEAVESARQTTMFAIALPADPAMYAQEIYNALHRADDAAANRIFIEKVPDDDAWTAIRDRLARASA
jgi:L-threonylcarbamoyladenylate synthase